MASDKNVWTRYTRDPGLKERHWCEVRDQTPLPHTPALPFWCVNGQWKEDTFFLSSNACISIRTRKSGELEVAGTRKVSKTVHLKHEEWRDAQPTLYDNLFPSSWPEQNIHLAGFLSHTVGVSVHPVSSRAKIPLSTKCSLFSGTIFYNTEMDNSTTLSSETCGVSGAAKVI